MSPAVLSKWILIIGGLLAGLATVAYVGMLYLVPPVPPVPATTVRVDPAQFKLATLPPRHHDYVGSQACRECHPKVYEQYQGHPMARSAGFIHEVPVIENYETGHPVPLPGGKTLFAERHADGKVTHHEKLEDGQGVVYDMAVPIDLEFGSGQRGRSYVTNREGILTLSPLTWYSTKSAWGLSPGYSPQGNPRFTRRAVDGCIQCHVGRVHDAPDARDRLRPPYLAEAGLGCERCHGPGGRHIEFHRQPQPGLTDPIVNPVKLSLPRRDAVCNQCHLQGVERVLQYGRTEYDFRPGDLLSDIWVPLVDGTRMKAEATQAVSQVEQMESSGCYEATQGALGCISCHDPHGVPAPEQRLAFYREKCVACHGPDQTQCGLPPDAAARQEVEDSCIACHMPKIATHDVPHTAATDHRILKVPAPAEGPPEAPQQIRIYAEGDHQMPEAEKQRARGIYLTRIAERQRDPQLANDCLGLLGPIVAANPDDIDSLHAMGVLHWMQGGLQDAERHWDRILAIDPNNERALADLAIICHDAEVFEAGLVYLNELIQVNPWRADLYGRKAHMLGRLGRFQEGIEAAKKVLELDPSVSQMHGWLAEAYEALNDPEQAQAHRQQFRRMAGGSGS